MSILSAQILEVVREKGRATISEIEEITRANRNTIKGKLKELVEKKYLVKHGQGRGVWYSIII